MKNNFFKRAAVGLTLALGYAYDALAQATAEGFINNATSSVKTAARAAINLVSALIGLIGVLMLAWNFMKRAKGDQQSSDALMNWGSSLLFVAIALQAVKYFIGS